MELTDFEKVNPMTRDFRGLSVTFNPDAFTEGFFFSVAERFRRRFTEEVESIVTQASVNVDKELPESAQRTLRMVNDIADRIKLNGDVIEANKRYYAALLVGTPDAPVLLQWDLTKEGAPVPCNEEGLLTLKDRTLKDLWEFVGDAANPKSQGMATIPDSQTTKQPTQSLSASPETQPEEDRLM